MPLPQSKEPRNPYKLPKGSISEVAEHFNVKRATISVIWKRGKESLENGGILNVASKKKGVAGRKKKALEIDKFKEIPLTFRKNIRSIAAKMDIPKSAIHRRFKEGVIKRHSNSVKPFLTEKNKIERVQFCLSKIDPCSRNFSFQDSMNTIHIDEKWFYISENKANFYLAADEDPPLRTVKSKRFMTKVMFIAAVARPRHDTSRNCQFDGKIGIFPFICIS